MPSYTVIIPAYNEQAFLPNTLIHLFDAMNSVDMPGEVIVVDNNSDDNTADIAREHGVKVIFEPVNQISRARNTGARAASSKYLVFLDADTTVSGELLSKALYNLSATPCCGGGVLVAMDNTLPALIQPLLDFWNWLSIKFNLAAGCFIYCLREGFQDVGGFSEKVYASEEIWLSLKIARWGVNKGLKFNIIKQPKIITSHRKMIWYAPWKIIFLSLPIILFPPLLRVRRYCSAWYHRPDID